MDFEILGNELDEPMKVKYNWTVFRTPIIVKTMNNINLAMLLKAFDAFLTHQKTEQLSMREYNLLKFIVKDGLNINYSDIYKSSFSFSNLVIQDIADIEKAGMALSILDAFLQCTPIQKTLFDEWYGDLSKVFHKVFSEENDDSKKCQEIIKEYINRWINDMKISQIVRDDIKKLTEEFGENKQPKEGEEEENNEEEAIEIK